MNRNWIRAIPILAMLLISMISLSMAACPKAMPDLYQTVQCGGVLEIPAPGILKNDVKDPGKTLEVESYRMDPKYGELVVGKDGSFEYTASLKLASGSTAIFYYNVTDGSCVSAETYVKIPISCRCHPNAPSGTYCLGITIDEIRDDLRAKGAGCVGCYDVTGELDLSKVNVNVAGSYPYYVTGCPGCAAGQGTVTIVEPCEGNCVPFTVCADDKSDDELREEIREKVQEKIDSGEINCGDCDVLPEIKEIVKIDDHHWQYTVTCESLCGPTEKTCTVEICSISWEGFTVPCEEVEEITAEDIISLGQVTCTNCVDATPVVTDWHLVDPEARRWEYTIECNGCTDTGEFFDDCACICVPEAPPLRTCVGEPLKNPDDFIAAGAKCEACDDDTPEINDSEVDYNTVGQYTYTVICQASGPGCQPVTEEGVVDVVPCPRCCEARAPPICTCVGYPLDDEDFIDNGAACIGEDCPAPFIDDSKVDYNTLGRYEYTVSCGDEDCPVATGYVCVRDILCGPVPGTYSTTTLLAGQHYNAGTVTVSLDNQGYLVVDMMAAQDTDPCGDWTFDDSHLYIGLEPLEDCNPGGFPYQDPVISTPTHIQYKVRLSSIPGYICEDEPTIYVDVHASMNSENCGGQTAWAVGNCGGGCGWPQTPVGEICFEIPCDCYCPLEHCPPCK